MPKILGSFTLVAPCHPRQRHMRSCQLNTTSPNAPFSFFVCLCLAPLSCKSWMGTRCVVISIIVVPPSEFTSDDPGFLVGGRYCPLLFLVSTDPFPPTVPSPGDFPPGSQIPGHHFQGPFVAELCARCFAAPHAHGPRPGFLVRHVDSVLALLWQHIKLSLSPSRRRLVHASGPSIRVTSRQRLKSVLASLHRCFLPTPCLTIRSGLQRFVLRGDGSFSLTSELDAGSALSSCRCGVCTGCTSPRSYASMLGGLTPPTSAFSAT